MSTEFEAAIRRLWTGLRLPPPAFGPKPEVTLSVDGIDLTLAETEDGLGLAVTGRPGRLSSDPVERDRQVERVLKLALGLLASNRSGIGLDRADPTGSAILIERRHAYRGGTPAGLIEAVEEVLRAVEIVAPDLAPTGRRPPAGTAAEARPAFEESIIFRP